MSLPSTSYCQKSKNFEKYRTRFAQNSAFKMSKVEVREAKLFNNECFYQSLGASKPVQLNYFDFEGMNEEPPEQEWESVQELSKTKELNQ